jgi:hypothetical protein
LRNAPAFLWKKLSLSAELAMNRKNLEKCVPTRQEAFAVDESREAALAPEDDYWEGIRGRFTKMRKEKRERDSLSRLVGATERGFTQGFVEVFVEKFTEDFAKKFTEDFKENFTEDFKKRFQKTLRKELQKALEESNFIVHLARSLGETTGLLRGQILAARSMLADGLPIESIAKYSGLSAGDIDYIR